MKASLLRTIVGAFGALVLAAAPAAAQITNFPAASGAPAAQLNMLSGNFYSIAHSAVPVNGSLGGDNAIACPIYIPNAVTINDLGATMNGTNTGSHLKFALFNTINSRAGTRLGATASCSSAGAGADVDCAMTSAVAVTPGIYWVGIVADTGVSVLSVASGDVMAVQMGATTLAALAGNTPFPMCQINNATTFSGGFSSPFGGSDRFTNGNTPLSSIKIQ